MFVAEAFDAYILGGGGGGSGVDGGDVLLLFLRVDHQQRRRLMMRTFFFPLVLHTRQAPPFRTKTTAVVVGYNRFLPACSRRCSSVFSPGVGRCLGVAIVVVRRRSRFGGAAGLQLPAELSHLTICGWMVDESSGIHSRRRRTRTDVTGTHARTVLLLQGL